MPLSTEQRAKRRTKKINNRVAKALPLFAATPAIGQFLTSEEEQKLAVLRWDAINEKYFAHLDDVDKEFVIRADVLRSKVAEIYPETLHAFDEKLERLKKNIAAYRNNPAYVADYWHCILKG